jgi:hypothetical protein
VKKDSIVLLQYHRAPSLVSHTRNFITSVPHFLTHAAGRVPIFDTAANEDEKCTAVIAGKQGQPDEMRGRMPGRMP